MCIFVILKNYKKLFFRPARLESGAGGTVGVCRGLGFCTESGVYLRSTSVAQALICSLLGGGEGGLSLSWH